MENHRVLVETVLVLLRQARTEIAGDHVRGLADSLDEAIALLESLNLEVESGASLIKVLDVIGKGLSTIEIIRRLIGGK